MHVLSLQLCDTASFKPSDAYKGGEQYAFMYRRFGITYSVVVGNEEKSPEMGKYNQV